MADAKLLQLTQAGNFRAKVAAVLSDVAGRGQVPKIAEALRTPARQRELVRKGFSKTLKSLHLAGKDGLARAADVVDAEVGWNAHKRFWLLLGSSCMAHEVGWGGLFGLNARQKEALKETILKLRRAGWPADDDLLSVRMGWDPCHCEARNKWN